MNTETELARLTKENDHFKKIIKTQQSTIVRMVDYFILGKSGKNLQSESCAVGHPTKKNAHL